MNSKELIKLDVDMMECFDQEAMLVVKGGGVKEVIEKIIDTLTGGGNENCSCNNCNCG